MTETDVLQRRTDRDGQYFALQAEALQTAFNQLFSQHQQFVAGIDQGVIKFRMDVERLVSRNGPRRSGPDHDTGGFAQARQTESGGQLVIIFNGKGNVDSIGFFILILDFRLGQGRAAIETPVDRLQTLEHKPLLNHFGQGTDFAGLVGKVHGLVGLVPIAQHAKAHEISLLPFYLLAGIGAAALTGQIRWLILTEGNFNLVLNRQPVAVPARHIRRIEAGQGLGASDEILEDFIHRMADMNAAVGIRRAVVQHELRPIFAELT